jgi:hypothetical protein
VGFGDVSPMMSQGRLVACATILAGVAIKPAQAASLAEAFLDFQKELLEGKRQQRTPPSSSLLVSVITIAFEKIVATSSSGGEERRCGKCGAAHHRNDASFCWSCGMKMP